MEFSNITNLIFIITMKTFKPFYAIALLTSLLFSCSKSKNNPTPAPITSTVKITLVSGNNQNAAIGYSVADSIVVKVTDNGTPASNYDVQFIGSGCNEDLVTDVKTRADGTAKYLWSMASNLGTQTLNAVAINQNHRLDSISISATAVAPVGLAPKSACIPNPGYELERIIQLNSGRLIASFYLQASLRYSDDNGTSWYPVKSFGANHFVASIATSPQDEIFVATKNEGVFYSKDAGNTWSDISPPTFNKADLIADITYTKSGKVIFTGLSNDVYISPDKGKTWTHAANGLGTGGSYTSPVELNNGDLYILCGNNVLYKSTDGGQSWTSQNTRLTVNVTAIYADNNGWFYEASETPASNQDIIAISKDNGATFSNLVAYTSPTNQPYLNNMSVQSDGLFYFGSLSYAICRIASPNQVSNYALMQLGFAVYIVTKSNRFLYLNTGGIYYF